ncbi:One cut domain family member [Aphelenchoides bicaudatus]|nr:One cut domain family member [Aphelenchoides bicaudatus]
MDSSADSDPLNVELDDNIYIDTRDLCERIAVELKQHAIPQSIFAEKILCRSQGTLSDLLRNPRPWNELKSGRETFRRMFNWLQQPLHVRLSILDMYNGPQVLSRLSSNTPRNSNRSNSSNLSNSGRIDKIPASLKKSRFVFTEVQKRTLQAIFNETQRPSRDMQNTIAHHLGLDSSTVANYFMNARRRASKLQRQNDE